MISTYSLVGMAKTNCEVYEDDGDIYDLPPEEDIEEDLYEEPSDSSGGAVVVRPPPKPPRTAEDDDTYLPMTEEQDMYEAPMEGEDISPVHSASRQNNFIPTKVAQGKNFVNVPTMNNNTETYEVPDMDDEVNYEIPETGTEVPPPRPPKSNVKPAHASQGIPTRPPKQVTPSSKATVGRPPPQENSMPQPKRALSKHGTPFQLPQQTSPTRHPKPNTLTQQNRPNTLPKQLSPSHIAKSNPLSNNLSPQKSPTHHPRPATQGPPLQPKASTAQPKLTPQPAEEKRPALAPKVSPRPKPLADPAKRGPAPSPGSEPHRKTSGPPSSPQKSSAPVSPPVNQIVRKVSGPKSGPPDSPKNESSAFKKAPLPGPPVTGERPLPRPTPRGGLLSQREVPSVPGPELPQKSSSGPPLPSGRRPVPSFPENQPSVPEPSPTEATPPPRPPKHGSSAQPSLPARHSQKSAPLPVPPSERKSAPLPAPPSDKRGLPPPPMNSHPSKSPVSREQSSGSSIESGSADEPVVSFGPKKTPTRGLPQLPPTPQEKGPLDAMKEAPWFHGAVDRRKSEVNLQSTKMDGAFLVRNSTKNPNDYSLSLLYKGNIRHLKLPKKDGQYVLGASGVQRFDSIIDLINYYRVHEVDLVSGGKTKLTIHAQNIAR